MDMNVMQSLVWKFFTQQVSQLPPEAKEALKSLTVEIVRQPDRVIVRAKPNDNPVSGKAATVVLDSIIQPVSRICAAFGCQIEIFK